MTLRIVVNTKIVGLFVLVNFLTHTSKSYVCVSEFIETKANNLCIHDNTRCNDYCHLRDHHGNIGTTWVTRRDLVGVTWAWRRGWLSRPKKLAIYFLHIRSRDAIVRSGSSVHRQCRSKVGRGFRKHETPRRAIEREVPR